MNKDTRFDQFSRIKRLILCLICLNLNLHALVVHAETGDIHGRQLAAPFLGFVGHIGIEYNDNTIIDMGGYFINDYSPMRMISDVRRSTPEEFHNFSPTWGVRYLDDQADRAADLAWKTWFIGADFTITTRHRRAQVIKDSRGRYVPIKGFYRCDLLVMDSYKDAGYNIQLPNPLPLLPYNIFNNGFPYEREEYLP